MLRAMPPIALSKSKLLSFRQCPKRVWLETYRPELEEEPAADRAARLATGNAVGELARQLYGRGKGQLVRFDRGLRAAIDATRALLAAGGSEPIFEATFDHAGVSVRIDVLDRGETPPRVIEVKAATRVKEHHLDDCAIQAWALTELGLAPRQIVVATVDTEFVYGGHGNYEGLLKEHDVTEAVRARLAAVPGLVADTRATLDGLDEPAVAVGPQCRVPHSCDFRGYCGPAEVPPGEPVRVGAELRELVRSLPFPRYYLDFETVAPAVPLFAGTRPYETLPFQWSCHVEPSAGQLDHREFLDLTGELALQPVAETLLAALGDAGPIVVYTGYEGRVLRGLAARFPDLAPRLEALCARIVDLHAPTKAHYVHPALRGSWSLKSVLPTIAPDLTYARLAEVRDGLGAQAAYLEAIAPATSETRRAELRGALTDYCRHDTLALVRLVEFFGRGVRTPRGID
jgi:Domain of unknown function(DUF2779)